MINVSTDNSSFVTVGSNQLFHDVLAALSKYKTRICIGVVGTVRDKTFSLFKKREKDQKLT